MKVENFYIMVEQLSHNIRWVREKFQKTSRPVKNTSRVASNTNVFQKFPQHSVADPVEYF